MNSNPKIPPMPEAAKDIIPKEDVALIRSLVGLPKESKILARGIILGLDIADRAEYPSA